MHLLGVFILFLIVFHNGLCDYNFLIFPSRHEWIYEYSAKIYFQIHQSNNHENGYKIDAKLHLHSLPEDTVIMQLANIKSTYFNGNNISGEIPKDNIDLNKPFKVLFKDGKIKEFFVSSDDKNESVNMKKAIAGLFHLELNKLNENYFNTNEAIALVAYIKHKMRGEYNQTIYGDCKYVRYSVVNSTDRIKINKWISLNSCSVPGPLFKTSREFNCPNAEPEADSFAERNYVLKRPSESRQFYKLEKIDTIFDAIPKSPINDKEIYRAVSKQTVVLKKWNALSDGYTAPPELTERETLNFEFKSMLENYVTEEVAIDEIKSAINRFLQENDKKTEALVSASTFMSTLNENGLKILFDGNSSATDKTIMLQVLSRVGTSTSIKFLMKYILEHYRIMNLFTSLKIITQYPFFFKTKKKEEFLQEMHDLVMDLNEEKYPELLINAAVLSFTNLVYNVRDKSQCEEKDAIKFVDEFSDRYRKTESHAKKALYLHGLRNLHYGNVENILLDVVADKNISRHLRYNAMGKFMTKTRTTDSQRIYKTLWTILTDPSEHYELRTGALISLIKLEPDPSRLLGLFWYVQSQSCPHLHDFLHWTLHNIEDTDYPCYKYLKHVAYTLSKFMKPKAGINYATNMQTYFGNRLRKISFINSYLNNFEQFYYEYERNHLGEVVSNWAVFFKYVYETVHYDTEDSTIDMKKLIAELGLKEYFTDMPYFDVMEQENNLEEFVMLRDKKVIIYKSNVDQYYHMSLVTLLKYEDDGPLEHFHLINPIIVYDYIIGTDFGTLAYIGVNDYDYFTYKDVDGNNGKYISEITKIAFTDFRPDGLPGIFVNTTVSYLNEFTLTMSVYNPVLKTIHRITKLKSVELDFSANGNIKIDLVNSIVSRKWIQGVNNKNGLFLAGETDSFIGTFSDAYLPDKPKSTYYSIRRIGNEIQTNSNIQYIPWKSMGIKIKIGLDGAHKNLWAKVTKYMAEFDFKGLNMQDWKTYVRNIYKAMDNIYEYTEENNYVTSIELVPYYDETTIVELDSFIHFSLDKWLPLVGLKTTNWHSGRVYKESAPNEMTKWNVIMNVVNDHDLFKHLNLKIATKQLQDSPQEMVCLDVGLHLTKALSTSHHEADFKNLLTFPETNFTLDFKMGKFEDMEKCPDESVLNVNITGSVSEKQEKDAREAEKYPFKQCKEYSESVKKHFNPAFPACLKAAQEVSTYRSYKGKISWKNENKQISTLLKMLSFFDVLNTTDNNEVELKNIKVIPPFNPKLEIIRNSNTDGFGTCIVSTDIITDFYNVTRTGYDTNRSYVLLADNAREPTFIIMITPTDDKYVQLAYYSPDGFIKIIPKKDGFNIFHNDKQYEYSLETQSIHWYNFYLNPIITVEDEVYMEHVTRLGKHKITHQGEYIVVTGYMGNTIGLCNPKHEDFIKGVVKIDYNKTDHKNIYFNVLE